MRIKWETYDRLLQDILRRLGESGFNAREICGIPNGGLMIAVPVAKNLGLKTRTTTSASSAGLVLCADILDTGKTIRLAVEECGSRPAMVVALYAKPRGLAYLWSAKVPSVVGMEIDDNTGWITFPWEKYDT